MSAVALALTLAASSACAPDARRPARHVLLISVDTLRADRLGCYGASREDVSPRLDALATAGTRFARAYAPSSWTLPSHATLLTGVSQRTHGAITAARRLAADLPTLATMLHDAGFRTRGVHSGPFLGRYYGFDRGFELYESCQSGGEETGVFAILRSHSDETNPCLRETFARWVSDAYAEDRHFWFVHMWDPHYDYIPPASYVRRFDPAYRGKLDGRNVRSDGFPPLADARDVAHLLARYDGEIRYSDDTIAAMLAALDTAGLLADTLVVVTADHGEEFREHGGKGHFRTVFAEAVAVPLILAGPGVPAGQVVPEPVGLVDVTPTILDLLGVPARPVEGESLLALMRGEPVTPRPAVSVLYDPTPSAWGPLRAIAVRLPEVTLLLPGLRGNWVAFDPARDTLEQTPLPPDREALGQARAALKAATLPTDPPSEAGGEPRLPRALEERLRNLGYLD